jgi:DnaK suppressor protein
MAQIDIAVARERLEAERMRLKAEIHEHTQGDSVVSPLSLSGDANGMSSEQADDAGIVENAERMNAITRNSQMLLDQVNQALACIANGTYGVCIKCGKEIAPRRMEALPYAALCIECQAQAEHENQ